MAGTLHKGPRYVHTQGCLGLARSTCEQPWAALKDWFLLLLHHMQVAARTDPGRHHLSAKHIYPLIFSKCDDLGCLHAQWDIEACSTPGVLYMHIAEIASSVSSNCMQSLSL